MYNVQQYSHVLPDMRPGPEIFFCVAKGNNQENVQENSHCKYIKVYTDILLKKILVTV